MKLFLLWVLLCLSAQAMYKAPQQVDTFRVENIELDVDTIEQLSMLLTHIAARPKTSSLPEYSHYRVNAQLLYLALALNPKNEQAQTLNHQFIYREEIEVTPHKKLKRHYQQLASMLHYLQGLDSSIDARRCGMMIKDALYSIRSSHRIFNTHRMSLDRWEAVLNKEQLNNIQREIPHTRKTEEQSTFFSINFSNADKKIELVGGGSLPVHQNISWIKPQEFPIKGAQLFSSNSFVAIQKETSITHKKPLSISVWMKNLKEENTGSIISNLNSKKAQRGWNLWLNKGKPTFEMNHIIGQNSMKVSCLNNIPVGKWFNLTMTYDGTGSAAGVKFYINGKLNNSHTLENKLTRSIRHNSNLIKIGTTTEGLDLQQVKIAQIDAYTQHFDSSDINKNLRNYLKPERKQQASNPNSETSTNKNNLGVFTLRGQPRFNKKRIRIKTPLMFEKTLRHGGVTEKQYPVDLRNIEVIIKNPERSINKHQFFMRPKVSGIGYQEVTFNQIRNLLKNQFGDVKKSNITIRLKGIHAHTNKNAIGASTTLALGASIVDKDIPKNTIVIGEFTSKHSFENGSNFIKFLPSLMKQTKHHRVIVGKRPNKYLKQLLVEKNPTFFIKNEIISCDNYITALEEVTLANKNRRQAAEIFQQIISVCPDDSIEHKSRADSIRRKLKEILRLNPDHVSAQMILAWSLDQRSNFYDSFYANLVLSQSLEIINQNILLNQRRLNKRHVYKAKKELKAYLGTKTRYFQGEEKEHMEDLIQGLRELKTLEELLNANLKPKNRQVRRSLSTLNRSYNKLKDTVDANILLN